MNTIHSETTRIEWDLPSMASWRTRTNWVLSTRSTTRTVCRKNNPRSSSSNRLSTASIFDLLDVASTRVKHVDCCVQSVRRRSLVCSSLSKTGRAIQSSPYQLIRGICITSNLDFFPTIDLADLLAFGSLRRIIQRAFWIDVARAPRLF